MSRATHTATRMSRRPGTGVAPSFVKSLNGLDFPSRLAMASGLLTAVIAMGGCLIPQDYLFSDDPPPFKNNPVKVVLPVPDDTTLTLNNGFGGTTACRLTFKVSATDPDLNDPITVRWYVDYDPDSNRVILQEDLLANLGTPERGPAELVMDLGAPGNPLFPARTHVLEALVADGQLRSNRTPLPKSTDPDAGENPSYVDRFVWVINTEPGDCP